MRKPPAVVAASLVSRGGMKSEDVAQAAHSTTTQSPDGQVKLAICPTLPIPPRHFSLKHASCCIGYFAVTIPRQGSGSGSSGIAPLLLNLSSGSAATFSK